MKRASSECGSMAGPSTDVVVCEDADLEGFGSDCFLYVGEIH